MLRKRGYSATHTNSMLFRQTNQLPPGEDQSLRKRAKYMVKCQEAISLRWTKEYIHGLRDDCVNKADGSKHCRLKVGEVQLLQFVAMRRTKPGQIGNRSTVESREKLFGAASTTFVPT